jgi:hypothetical protein
MRNKKRKVVLPRKNVFLELKIRWRKRSTTCLMKSLHFTLPKILESETTP